MREAVNLKEVVKQYVASRRGSATISTSAAEQAIAMILPIERLVTRSELENMIAAEAVRQGLAVHFDASDNQTTCVTAHEQL